MSDKARRSFAVPVSFAEGEQPTHTKLNAVSSQARNSLGVLERITGDPWNQAGDPVLSPGASPTANALHIPNIARALGDLGLLNPRSFVPTTTTSYEDPLGTRYVNRMEGFLRYRPTAGSTFTLAGTFAPLTQAGYRAYASWDSSYIDASNKWSVDANGKFYSGSPIPSGLRLVYAPDMAGEAVGGTFSVIPDPSTWGGAYAGLKITFANGTNGNDGYHLWLPPRMPLTGGRITNRTPDSAFNSTATPDAVGAALVAYQAGTADASTQAHYRYTLSAPLSGLAAGTTLPSGFLYLWDETRGTIVEGVTMRVPAVGTPATHVLHATGADLNTLFIGLVAAGGFVSTAATQAPADYITRFKLIVVGNSLTSSLNALWGRFLSVSTEAHRLGIPHSSLTGLVTPQFDTSINASYPTAPPVFFPSRWADDHHSQYLHRTGSTGDLATLRDDYDNAMVGPLLMASTVAGAGATYRNTTADSHPIRFGNTIGERLIRGLTRALAGTTDDNVGIEIDTGAPEGAASYLVLTRNRLQFGTSSTRGLLVKDGNYFKFGASGSSIGEARVGPARLVAGGAIFHNSATDLRSNPSESPTSITPRLVVAVGRIGDLIGGGEAAEAAVVYQPSSSHDLLVGTNRYVLLDYLVAGSSPANVRRINSNHLERLTNTGFATGGAGGALTSSDAAVGTRQLHKHNIWGNSAGLGNKIGVIAGEISFFYGDVVPSPDLHMSVRIPYSGEAVTVEASDAGAPTVSAHTREAGSFTPDTDHAYSATPLITFGLTEASPVNRTVAILESRSTTDFVIRFHFEQTSSLTLLHSPRLSYMVIGPVDTNRHLSPA